MAAGVADADGAAFLSPLSVAGGTSSSDDEDTAADDDDGTADEVVGAVEVVVEVVVGAAEVVVGSGVQAGVVVVGATHSLVVVVGSGVQALVVATMSKIKRHHDQWLQCFSGRTSRTHSWVRPRRGWSWWGPGLTDEEARSARA